ncbi:hypothetical protein BJ138DRAFT_1098514 [Hygrophoropsis aurantiaca]|uniref:Uncharacterized protein n=1 Tax=Hygrophoropsis aurantiaca TaxID=72124 RepID=A0ACB8AMU9_9AGAM|nr:hypothetical protein BJ138DRAFT_1098514 [Hygrophoropsis aurantiaca]
MPMTCSAHVARIRGLVNPAKYPSGQMATIVTPYLSSPKRSDKTWRVNEYQQAKQKRVYTTQRKRTWINAPGTAREHPGTSFPRCVRRDGTRFGTSSNITIKRKHHTRKHTSASIRLAQILPQHARINGNGTASSDIARSTSLTRGFEIEAKSSHNQKMLPSRFAAFICLTLASLATAGCPSYPGPHRDKDTYTLYFYKGYDCTGTVLKYPSQPVNGKCRNLPVPTKNKKTGQLTGTNWNDQVKSLVINAPTQAFFKMYKDRNCKTEYGEETGGLWSVPNMTHVELYDYIQDKSVHKNMRGMSSYLVTN